MNAIELFLLQHSYAQSVVDRTLLSLTEEQLHTRPYEGANSIAWVVWHMARVEDVIAPIVVGEPNSSLTRHGPRGSAWKHVTWAPA